MVLTPLSEAISQRKSVGLCSPVVELFPLCKGFEVFRLPHCAPHPCWVLMLVPCGVHDTVKEQPGWVAGAFWQLVLSAIAGSFWDISSGSSRVGCQWQPQPCGHTLGAALGRGQQSPGGVYGRLILECQAEDWVLVLPHCSGPQAVSSGKGSCCRSWLLPHSPSTQSWFVSVSVCAFFRVEVPSCCSWRTMIPCASSLWALDLSLGSALGELFLVSTLAAAPEPTE